MTSEVTVVVGNYEGADVLQDCLVSLREQTHTPAEVIVADASSADASPRIAAEHGARVLVAPNVGLGHLYNRGVEAAATELVLLVNNDVALDRRCVELLAHALSGDDRRFAAGSRQLDWSGARVVQARAAMRRGPLLRRALPGFELDLRVPADRVCPTVFANGAAMMVRRRRHLDLGGFDETFFMDFEDIDLCWRAWLRGWSSVYVPDAWVRHRVGAVTSGALLPRRLVSSHHNLLRFALKCLPARAVARVVLGELLRLPAHPRVIAPALASVVHEAGEIARLRRRVRPSATLLEWMLAGMPE